MDHLINELALIAGGLISGILAGLLGSGGGFLTVPIMLAFNYTPLQAIGTTGLAVSIIAVSACIQNSRMGYFSLRSVLFIGLPALITTQISVYIANQIQPYVLLVICGSLMLLLIYLVELRKKLIAHAKRIAASQELAVEASSTEADREWSDKEPIAYSPKGAAYSNQTVAYALEGTIAPPDSRTGQTIRKPLPRWLTSMTARRSLTGGLAGLFAGMVGGGSGSVLVPMQMLILGEGIKTAIQTSIGVNLITSVSAWLNHAFQGNVLFLEGFLLGTGGFLGAQIGTRFLPKLPDHTVKVAFNSLIVILALYIFWKAWKSYSGF
jgi:hypothetical protein